VLSDVAMATNIGMLFAITGFVMTPYGIGQAIIFLPCGFFYFLLLSSIFFPRLISAVGDWMPTILPHMVWP